MCVLCETETVLPKRLTEMEIGTITTSSPAYPEDFGAFVFTPPVVEQGIIEHNDQTPEIEQEILEPIHKQPEFLTTPTMSPPE